MKPGSVVILGLFLVVAGQWVETRRLRAELEFAQTHVTYVDTDCEPGLALNCCEPRAE